MILMFLAVLLIQLGIWLELRALRTVTSRMDEAQTAYIARSEAKHAARQALVEQIKRAGGGRELLRDRLAQRSGGAH